MFGRAVLSHPAANFPPRRLSTHFCIQFRLAPYPSINLFRMNTCRKRGEGDTPQPRRLEKQNARHGQAVTGGNENLNIETV